MTYLTNYQAKDLIKMNKHPSKWPWFSQINHIEWIGFSHIDHYNLTLKQMNRTHLMI